MLHLRDEDHCSECSSVLRSDEVERRLCEVCFYYPEEKKMEEVMIIDQTPGMTLALDIEEPWRDMPEEEDDFLSGVTCNPNAPEECESCQ